MSGAIFICGVSPEFWIIDRAGKTWCFEWHSYFGPAALNKRTGDVLNYPLERSPFWEAVTEWDKQGRKTTKGFKGRTYAMWTKADLRRTRKERP